LPSDGLKTRQAPNVQALLGVKEALRARCTIVPPSNELENKYAENNLKQLAGKTCKDAPER
jgi:hypothetical protein